MASREVKLNEQSFLQIRIPTQLKLQVQAAAQADSGRTMKSWIIAAIQERLQRQESPPSERPRARSLRGMRR